MLRALASSQRGDKSAAAELDVARVFVNDAGNRVEAAARQALAAMAEGDTLRTQIAALRRLLKLTPINTVTPRRAIADATVSRGGYIFAY